MERLFLFISTVCFLIGFARTVVALRSGHFHHSPFNLVAMAVGFAFQTAFLAWRGHTLRHCPLTNLFEFIVFLTWTMVLLYLLIGPAYRLSLLGAFTAPLVFVLQTVALAAPIDTLGAFHPPNFWLEAHAALSVIAYGAFGTASIAGIMYLAQEKQLKTHRLRPIFFEMPPIVHLATTNLRLIGAGFLLLTLGTLAGIAVRTPANALKQTWGMAIWAIYLAILLAHRIGPRRIALLSVSAFLLALSSLGWINYFAHPVHP